MGIRKFGLNMKRCGKNTSAFFDAEKTSGALYLQIYPSKDLISCRCSFNFCREGKTPLNTSEKGGQSPTLGLIS